MRTLRTVTAALLAAGGLLATAGPALADDPPPASGSATPSPGSDPDSPPAPTEAGTSFRTATLLAAGQRATADGSTGDYLYWAVPLDQGQDATVRAKVKLPETAGHSAATWQLDVYDGLRRRQSCRYGMQARKAAADAGSVELACTLRTVRSWAEPWSNDPLPGRYYLRLTSTDLSPQDLGQPVHAEVEATVSDAGGAHAVDGALAAPLVPGAGTADAADDDSSPAADDDSSPSATASASPGPQAAAGEPDGGWSSGRWSDRWIWTAAGGVLAALGGIAGYRLTRGRGRPSRVPPGV
ncbi:hypothetical protein [Streptomyces sp. NPDC048644]|uniref:hypothetical protein n=1 Tax=Streptomyces sp. NPDC048644 TaxID=3365582 RepID=UPI003718AFD4